MKLPCAVYPWVAGLAIFVASACGGTTFSAESNTDDGGSGSNTTGSGGNSSGTGGGQSGDSTTGSGGGISTDGAVGTGGSAGAIGTGGTGGRAGAGGGVAHTDAGLLCTSGSTTFRMTEAVGTDYCVGTQCTLSWVSVKSMSGKIMSLSGGCVTSCAVCQPILCGAVACIAPQHLKPEGESLTWDGTYFETSKCGAGVMCQEKQCAPPGRYVATMCANKNTSDAGAAGFCAGFASTPTCVDVEFDYPSMKTVEAVLGAN